MTAKRATAPAASDRTKLLVQIALLALAGWLAFAPVLSADFVNWDDHANLRDNPAFGGLSLAHLRWMATTTHMGPYQPLAWLSLSLDHALGGFDAAVYHRTNLVLHVLGAVALLFLARALFALLPERFVPPSARGLAAFAAALFFLVHPLRCESVCWVTERRDVLCAPFFFLALLFWLRYASAPPGTGRRDYLLAHAALLLALLAKASAIVLPALLVLVDLGPLQAAARERGLRRLVLEKLPALFLAAAFAWIAVVGQARDAMLATAETHGPLARATQAGYAAWFYVTRTLWPAGLRPIHTVAHGASIFDAAYLAPALLALAVTIVLVARWKQWSPVAWAWCAYLVILAPVSGLAQSGAQLVAERYSYLACVPLALLAAGGFAHLVLRARGAALAVLAVVGGLLAWRTNVQSRTWHDSRALWGHALALDPDEDTALIDLAVLELEEGQDPRTDPRRAHELLLQANAHAARSAELRPEPRRLFNLAATHVRLADLEPEQREQHLARAVEAAERARSLALSRGVRIEPRWCVIQALALYYTGRDADALPVAEEALVGLPRDVDVRRLVIDLRGRLGRASEAVTLVQETLSLAPDYTVLWLDLARAWERAGDPQKSRDAAREGRQRVERAQGAAARSVPWYAELVQRSGDPVR